MKKIQTYSKAKLDEDVYRWFETHESESSKALPSSNPHRQQARLKLLEYFVHALKDKMPIFDQQEAKETDQVFDKATMRIEAQIKLANSISAPEQQVLISNKDFFGSSEAPLAQKVEKAHIFNSPDKNTRQIPSSSIQKQPVPFEQEKPEHEEPVATEQEKSVVVEPEESALFALFEPQQESQSNQQSVETMANMIPPPAKIKTLKRTLTQRQRQIMASFYRKRLVREYTLITFIPVKTFNPEVKKASKILSFQPPRSTKLHEQMR